MADNWHVTGQQQTQGYVAGRYVRGIEVAFTTRAGHSGTVFIPGDQYSPENVSVAVAAQAALMDAVGQLSG